MSDVDDDNEWSDYDEDFEGAVDEFIADGPESEYDYGANVNIPGARPNNQPIMSLQANCLECIVGNFEKFNDAFKTSGDRVLLRSLTFLQRVYTSEVINGLHNKGMLADKYLDFLINEYLKELDIGKFVDNKCSLKVIEERIKQVGQSFKRVSLRSSMEGQRFAQVQPKKIQEFLYATICHLSNVEVINIPIYCNDTILKDISAYCKKLTELYIDESSAVTENGVKVLCKNRDTECLIKNLSIENTNVLNDTIKFLLKNMPFLEILQHNSYLPYVLYLMHKEDLKNNTLKKVKKYNLKKLDFLSYVDDSNMARFLQVCTQVCPNIKILDIVTDSQMVLDLIARFSNLEDFTIEGRTFMKPNVDLNRFFKSNGSRLTHLKVTHFNVSTSNLIENCPNLENLTLLGVQFQKNDRVSSNFKLDSLKELYVGRVTFSEQCAEDSVSDIFASSPNLEKMSFKHLNFLTFEKLVEFCRDSRPTSSSLQSLYFYSCDVESHMLQFVILECPSITSLTIENCENMLPEDVGYIQHMRDGLARRNRNFIKIVYRDRRGRHIES